MANFKGESCRSWIACRRRVHCDFRTFMMLLGAVYFFAMYTFHASLDGPSVPRENRVVIDKREQDILDNSKSRVDAVVLMAEKKFQSLTGSSNLSSTSANQTKNEIETFFIPDGENAPRYRFEKNPVGNIQLQSHENIPEQCRQEQFYSQQDKFQQIGTNVYLYSAYWDERPNDFDNQHNGTYIRLMAIVWKKVMPSLTCEFPPGVDLEGKPYNVLRSQVTYYEMCENHNRPHGGYILSCRAPHITAPCSVNITFDHESLSVAIRTLKPLPTRRQFTICVPPLFGDVSPSRMIEFIETSTAIGNNHVVFYAYSVPPSVQGLLESYAAAGRVSLVPWVLDKDIDANIWYHGQLIAVQDCLYRNMATSDYVAFHDIDEFIVPHSATYWPEMTLELSKPSRCAFQFQCAFFDPSLAVNSFVSEVGLKLNAFGAVRRMSSFVRQRAKCLVKPYLIFEKGIHHVSKPIWAFLEVVGVEPGVAYLHHYRACTNGMGVSCVGETEDKSMLRYRERVVAGLLDARRNVLHI